MQKDWVEVTFTPNSIFFGLYIPDTKSLDHISSSSEKLRNKLPVELLRVLAKAREC